MKPFQPITRTSKRFRHHLWLAFISIATTSVLYGIFSFTYPSPQSMLFRWSLATGYIGAALLAVVLSLGTWKILRNRSNPVSTDLRRDIGIWCGVLSIAHVIIGLNVHMKSWTLYFVTETGGLRMDLFGLANYSGLAATIIVVILLATSNDFSLRILKSNRWKSVQRWNYVFAALVSLHAILFVIVENRIAPYLFVVATFLIWTLAIQIAGFRRRQSGMEERKIAVSEQI